MSFLRELEPEALWTHFDEILRIPRPSKKEERIRAYVLEVAARRGLDHRQDATGNVVVFKKASEGYESAPTVVLQSHLDMVTVRNSGVDHDFDRDPIRPRQVDGWIQATGTSLGADNGIGVAAMLALMEDGQAPHPPLELLFTMDEETGLTGAMGIGSDLLEGRLLVNLDSEDEGVLTVGCAGAGASRLSLPLELEVETTGRSGVAIHIAGLRGGHSGLDIHRHRANAIRGLARCLGSLAETSDLRIADFRGGESHNAIPREAHAVVAWDATKRGDLVEALEGALSSLREELLATEPGLSWSLQEVSVERSFRHLSSLQLLRLLEVLPHGVIAFSPDIEGLVETSTNLARAVIVGEELEVLLSSRSSAHSSLAALRQRIRAAAALAGAAVEEDAGYPGWRPDMGSPLLARVRSIYRETTGEDPEVGAVHAGLECGILGERYPGMDMISFGPEIDSPHSPDERVEIGSVKRFDELLRRVLASLARESV